MKKSERTVALSMRAFFPVVAGIIVAAAIVFCCAHVRALADDAPKSYKYYTSVKVQPGDTLWDIAGEYADGSVMTRKQFINEVTRINGLKDGNIKSGEYIVVVYYSDEQK